ncbi:MAG: TIGR02996 domain-containing protein [Gemmataceae bacterium]
MTEKDAFLADILERPDDDAPRLVYADWLDDHGEPDRATFIRAQCAGDAGAAGAFAARLGPWAGPAAELSERVEFHRGFVEVVHIHAEAFLAQAEALFRLTPLRLARLLYLYSDQLAALARLPNLSRLAALEATGNYRHAGFRVLCASPHLDGLAGLAVSDTPIGRAGLAALVESPSLSRLTHLHLGGTGIGPEGVQQLARSAKCRHLVALDLRGNALGPPAVRDLDRSPHLGELRRLGLWYNRLGDEGLAELVRTPLFARLTHLSLGNNRVTAAGLRLLADSPALLGLRTLWLGVDRYSPAGVEALTRSEFLHPEARVCFWLTGPLSEQVKQGVRRRLGGRVTFDNDPAETWEADPPVGWPLWGRDSGSEPRGRPP